MNLSIWLQKLRDKRHRDKTTADLLSVDHTQTDTPVSNIFATGLDTGIMATGESAVIQLHQTPIVEGFVS